MIIAEVRQQLASRIGVCWSMAEVFLANKDAHGLHDMGVEIQALQRALDELSKITPSNRPSLDVFGNATTIDAARRANKGLDVA